MSLYSMSSKKIVNSSNYVDDPVNKIIDKFDSDDKKRIILAGSRCSGKSIVLNAYSKNMLYSGEDAIYVFLEPGLEDKLLKDRQLAVRYELFLCNKILFYLKDNYYKDYKVYFRDIVSDIKEMNKLMQDYINNYMYEKVNFPKIISTPGVLLESVITRMKKVLGNDKLTVCLDIFDWRNQPVSRNFQCMAEYYFQFFDKVVLTTDDRNVYEDIDNRRDDLNNKGYQVIDVDYGKDKDIAKRIIKADLNYYANLSSENNHYDIKGEYVNLDKLIDKEVYDMLIEKSEGNFELLYATLRTFFNSFSSYYDVSDNNRRILQYFDWVMSSREDMTKKSYVKRLHL